jgi:hypothetical protein
VKILKTFRDAGLPSGFIWGRTVGSSNLLAVIVCVFRENTHYHLRSPLMMKAGPKGEAGGRRRKAVEVLSARNFAISTERGWQGRH